MSVDPADDGPAGERRLPRTGGRALAADPEPVRTVAWPDGARDAVRLSGPGPGSAPAPGPGPESGPGSAQDPWKDQTRA